MNYIRLWDVSFYVYSRFANSTGQGVNKTVVGCPCVGAPVSVSWVPLCRLVGRPLCRLVECPCLSFNKYCSISMAWMTKYNLPQILELQSTSSLHILDSLKVLRAVFKGKSMN